MERRILRRQTTHSAGHRDTGGMIRRHHYFKFNVINTQIISGQFSTIAGQKISVDWGDGSARNTYSGTDQTWSHDYGSAGNRTVGIFGSVVLTKFNMDAAGANISFNIASLPASLTYFGCYGNNTCNGDIASLPASLTHFYCTGNNTCNGDIASLPASLTYFYCTGSNTCNGDIASLPASLTYFGCTGNNTCNGDIASLPASLTYFYCTGSNTCNGDIASLPASLTYFGCIGNNTCNGDIASLPASLTYFYCTGSNTCNGDIASLPASLTHFGCAGNNTCNGDIASLPASLIYLYCTGNNTIADYTTPHTWTTKPTTFIVVPVGAGGLSTAEVDNLLIDFDADLVWAAGNVITLMGTNAARSVASDAAVANMVAEGATVTTN
uniref:Uncharacterized protein n=1 Tax=Candidatus Methanogaster sp. ANME-2c ERB4 TaxID=2759911 RepID=A0A7G9Y0M2_9EURY|nr:hypothetical protein MPGNBCFJ_00020 [Methanosarcinales archaeon ANME-2c ERB4]